MNKKNIYLGIGIVFLSAIMYRVGVITADRPMAKLANGQEVFAKIDGKDFTAEELYNKLRDLGGFESSLDLIDSYIANEEIGRTEEALDNAANQVAQYKFQAEQSGQKWSDIYQQNGFATEELVFEYFLSNYQRQETAKKFIIEKLTTKEIDDFYKTEIFGDITAKHILIIPDVTDSMDATEKSQKESEALALAKEIIEKYNNGTEWNDLVQQYSDDTGTLATNGELTFNKIGQSAVDPAFFEASLKLANGEITKDPVRSQFGYHIILKVTQKEKPSKEASLETIQKTLAEQKLSATERAYADTWASIREEYNLEIFDGVLKQAYKEFKGQ